MSLKHLAVATALAVAASGALADDQAIDLTQTSLGVFAGSFSDTHLVSGLFVDTFTFDLPSAFGSLLGSGDLTFASLSGPLSLVVATLDAANGFSVATPPDPASIAIPSSLLFADATAPLVLTVLGTAGDPFADPVPVMGNYNGTITFNTSVAAVPEPETYELMLAGLICVGYLSAGATQRRLLPDTTRALVGCARCRS